MNSIFDPLWQPTQYTQLNEDDDEHSPLVRDTQYDTKSATDCGSKSINKCDTKNDTECQIKNDTLVQRCLKNHQGN